MGERRFPPQLTSIFQRKEMTIVKIKTNVKAGGTTLQHNQTVTHGLKVKTTVKAGADGGGYESDQHNQTMTRALKVKSSVKAGIMEQQHNQTITRALKVRTGVKAGTTNGDIHVGS